MAGVSNTAPFKNPAHNDLGYVEAWRDFMAARDLLEEVQRIGPDVEVYSRRLVGVEWMRGGDWQSRIEAMMGKGPSKEAMLWRLFAAAKNRPECCNNNGLRGWKLT